MRMGRRPTGRHLLIAGVAAAAVTAAVAGVLLVATDLGDRLPLPWRPTNEAKFPAAAECATLSPGAGGGVAGVVARPGGPEPARARQHLRALPRAARARSSTPSTS